MPCYGYYSGLRHAHLATVLSYLDGGFVPIHEGHVAIHQDEVEAALFVLVGLDALFDLFDSLEAVEGLADQRFGVKFKGGLHYNL